MTLISLPTSSLVDFGRTLRLGERRLPIDGMIETTFRCNLRCAHCYVNLPAGARDAALAELPLPRLEHLLDEMVEAGTLCLAITGGEPLLRDDFPRFYRAALERGLLVTVFTNGTLVTEAVLDLFSDYRPQAIEITLYGMTRETYEHVTGVPGSHRRCIEAIERIVGRGLPLRLKSMALTWNQHELRAMESYAGRLGVPYRFDGQLNPRVDCGASRAPELQLSAEQLSALDDGRPERVQDYRRLCETDGQTATDGSREYVYSCGAGRTAFLVDPYGRLLPCALLRRNGFDLREGSFALGWNEHLLKMRTRRWTSCSPCRSCGLTSLCGNCPGAAELETDSPEAAIPVFCQTAHRRAFAALGEACGHRQDASCCLDRGERVAR